MDYHQCKIGVSNTGDEYLDVGSEKDGWHFVDRDGVKPPFILPGIITDYDDGLANVSAITHTPVDVSLQLQRWMTYYV